MVLLEKLLTVYWNSFLTKKYISSSYCAKRLRRNFLLIIRS